ncbi:hypothetical protein [Pseudomonas sp. L5B5]|uniref:hypothetical protein n=1 Tax=Pseudomonas sp. L5B5 TaxID=2883205 RepID=UPI001CFADD12|nr:hypothetical protein [Pseudomonas sp. L5B5]UCZ87177.1 hypothetical protein LGQ10_13045 [Pseudomonas sp. L5B5]
MSSKKKNTGPVVFLDTVYTSRVLVLPDGRMLNVANGQVSVEANDSTARDYLGQHPDLQAQE